MHAHPPTNFTCACILSQINNNFFMHSTSQFIRNFFYRNSNYELRCILFFYVIFLYTSIVATIVLGLAPLSLLLTLFSSHIIGLIYCQVIKLTKQKSNSFLDFSSIFLTCLKTSNSFLTVSAATRGVSSSYIKRMRLVTTQ